VEDWMVVTIDVAAVPLELLLDFSGLLFGKIVFDSFFVSDPVVDDDDDDDDNVENGDVVDLAGTEKFIFCGNIMVDG
jgi:hypothetical protein